jgi:putative ABC transport system substrate-binding protein
MVVLSPKLVFAEQAGGEFLMMKRRKFVTLLGSTVVAYPLASRARQQRPIPRIGLVSIGADPANPVIFRPFLQQFRELGYVEGQNVIFEKRFAAGEVDLISGFVADLVDRNVDVIVTTGQREGEAAKKTTSSIPIVTIVHPDPIGMGLAQSLAQPGGNVTGLTAMETSGIYGKRMELLKLAVPRVQSMGLMVSTRPEFKRDGPWRRDVKAVARTLDISLDFVEFDADTVDVAISTVAVRGVQGLFYPADGVAVARRKEIADSAIRHKLPTIFSLRQNADAGGLMSYSARVADLSRRAAFFVDRILKGTKPSDIPIEQATAFELVINLGTAKALGVTLPPSLLAIADEVIE